MRVDKTVKRETLYIICGSLLLSLLEQATFVALGKWELPVLFSNLMMDAVFILDFFFLGITLQIAVKKKDEKEIKNLMLLSRGLRFIMIGGALVVGILLDEVFNLWALLPPILFNRITLFVIQLRMKREEKPVCNSLGDDDETEDKSENE